METVQSPDGELKLISGQDLHQYWPFVKQGLEEAKQYSVEDWIAEDVYTALRNGTSTLHMAFVDNTYAGFCVLTITQGYSSKNLHIFCAYGVKGMNVVERFEPEIVKIAKSIGARKITFLSTRRWERRLKDYKAVQTVFEKDLYG